GLRRRAHQRGNTGDERHGERGVNTHELLPLARSLWPGPARLVGDYTNIEAEAATSARRSVQMVYSPRAGQRRHVYYLAVTSPQPSKFLGKSCSMGRPLAVNSRRQQDV